MASDVTVKVRELVSPFSVEITPKEAPSLPPLPELLAPGTAVYLTFLPNTPWAETVGVARSVAEAGMRPVPHLAARAVPDHRTPDGAPSGCAIEDPVLVLADESLASA